MSVIVSANRVRWVLKQIHTNNLFEVDPSDCRVGRCASAQVILNSTKASRTHSSFVVNVDGHLLVQDLNSANGTFLNGEKLEMYIRHRVSPGDIISFGLSHQDLAENDKDRSTFFEVLMEIPINKEHGIIDCPSTSNNKLQVKTENVEVIDLVDSAEEDNILVTSSEEVPSNSDNSNLQAAREFPFTATNIHFPKITNIHFLTDIAENDKPKSFSTNESLTTSSKKVLNIEDCIDNGLLDVSYKRENLSSSDIDVIHESSSSIGLDKAITTVTEMNVKKYEKHSDLFQESVIPKNDNALLDVRNCESVIAYKSKKPIEKEKPSSTSSSKSAIPKHDNVLLDEINFESVATHISKKSVEKEKHSSTSGSKSAILKNDTAFLDEINFHSVAIYKSKKSAENEKLSCISSTNNMIKGSKKTTGAKRHKIDINQDSILEISNSNNTSHELVTINNSNDNQSLNEVLSSRASNTKNEDDSSTSIDDSKASKNSFSTNKDASIIIDITEDDDADFSCSQIFEISEKVKTEIQDDNFQKIKSELAEMDFCEEELVLNQLPINLENDYDHSGFENTQDICACLEEDLVENKKTGSKNNGMRREIQNGNQLDFTFRDSGVSTSGELSFNNSVNEKRISDKKTRKCMLIEPLSEIKPEKKLTKKSSSPSKRTSDSINENCRSKRKKTREETSSKKKIKGVTTPGLLSHYDSKTIQMELKKRRSRSSSEMNKPIKHSVIEVRRKKLKDLQETIPKYQPDRFEEKKNHIGNTVKVLPQSKTNRGSFLCKQTSSTLAAIRDKPIKYELKPIDLPKVTKLNDYNLRRNNSTGAVDSENKTQTALPDMPRQVQNQYNLRHSSDTNVSTIFAVPHIPDNSKIIGDGLQRTRSNVAHKIAESKQVLEQSRDKMGHSHKFHTNSTLLPMHPPSSRLMYPSLGQNNDKRPLHRRLKNYCTDDIVQKIVYWLPNWLVEQIEVDLSPPINDPPARKIPLNFRNFEQYYEVFSKMIMLEKWQYLFKGFRESTELPRKAQIKHIRIANDLLYIDCLCYITEAELKKGSYYKSEDFLLMECKTRDNNNCYLSLNFGCTQRYRRVDLSEKDLLDNSTRDLCSGQPHSGLEFTIVTRYQSDKKIDSKGFILLKLMGNIGAHLKQIKAIKSVLDSPLCQKILTPRIEDYVFPVTQQYIMHPNQLNPQQREIVLEASSLCTGSSNGIYCIKGPPGTGKTSVIVNIVYQILTASYVTQTTEEPPMILLAAPSNTAVDNLLSKLVAKKYSINSEWNKLQGKVKLIRIGPESSMSEEGIQYSLTSLARNHILLKNKDVPQFKTAKERKENMIDFAKKYFGRHYSQELKVCEDILIKNSNIICTTLNSCVNGKLIDAVNRGLIKFSCCIIDEATQCHEVESLLPIMLGIDKYVLVGDPKQLNATIMNREASNLGYGESLFSRIANNFNVDPRSTKHRNKETPIKMLTDQYRMHPEICFFPNREFYEAKLRSLPNHPNKLPEKIRPYLVFSCEKHNDSADYTNMDEVYLIKKLLQNIIELVDTVHAYTFGIITPYNAQKDLISQNIKDLMSLKKNCKIVVNTVDSFQGSENDVIIISCVRNSTNTFLQNENRLNVALTRAKQVLYIIGNYTLFKECRPLYDLREDAKKRKVLIDIKQNPKTIENFSKLLVK